MPTTHDFAKLGRTTFLAGWLLDDGNEVYAAYGPSTEADTLEDAKAFLDANRGDSARKGRWWCRVEMGTYNDSSFDDSGEHVSDASWEPEEYFYCVGSIADDGTIEWDEED